MNKAILNFNSNEILSIYIIVQEDPFLWLSTEFKKRLWVVYYSHHKYTFSFIWEEHYVNVIRIWIQRWPLNKRSCVKAKHIMRFRFVDFIFTKFSIKFIATNTLKQTIGCGYARTFFVVTRKAITWIRFYFTWFSAVASQTNAFWLYDIYIEAIWQPASAPV